MSETYIYAGDSRNAEVRLARLVCRDQRRIAGGVEASLNRREFIGQASHPGRHHLVVGASITRPKG